MRTESAPHLNHQRVLVTGATGFMGGALLRRLLPMQGQLLGLYHEKSPTLVADHLSWRLCPANPAAMLELFREFQPDYVFHLAGSRRGSNLHQLLQRAIEANFQLTHSLLEASREVPVKAFLYAGTVAEYGGALPPFREDRPVSPVTPYAFSKLSGTLLTQQYGRHCGVNCCSARLFLTYGPGQGEDLFMGQLFRAWRTGVPMMMSPGEQTRDYLWIEDCLDGLLHLAVQPKLGGEIVNVCTGVETQLKEIVALLERLTGQDSQARLGALPYRPGEIMRERGDPTKLEQMTGYRPSTSLSEGLGLMLA